jgi:hypothetical protein
MMGNVYFLPFILVFVGNVPAVPMTTQNSIVYKIKQFDVAE